MKFLLNLTRTLTKRRNAMLMYFMLAAMSLSSVMFGSRCSAKDLEPVEPAKAQKAAWLLDAKAKAKAPKPRSAADRAKQAAMQTGLKVLKLAVGQTGILGNQYDATPIKFKVVSVVDGSNLIVEYDDRHFHGGRSSITGAVITRSYTTHEYFYFWLKGFSTKGVVDDDEVTIPWVVNVTGTRKYDTGRTVLVIEPRLQTDEELQAKAEVAQKKSALARKAAAEKARRTQWRTWADASRTHTVEAQYKGVIGGQVKLVKRDGTEISVPLEKLSEEDRGWIQDRKKQ